MSRRVLSKQHAKDTLGNNIFNSNWLIALVISFLSVLFIGLLPIILTGFFGFGVNYAFLQASRRTGEKRFDISDLFQGFSQNPARNFLIGLMTSIFISLWTLLLFIPGIVMYYAYSMTYFVAIDNPELSWYECIKESKRMMKGHKGELFVLDLSFIGWLIVGSLCCGIGNLWVSPYIQQTYANFYESLKGQE